MKKRGQIGLILIIVVVIVALSAIFYFFHSSSAKSKASAEVSKSVSDDYQPVIQYAEESLKQIAVNGIIELGEHGGVINPSVSGSVGKVDSTTGETVLVAYGLIGGNN